MESVTRSPRLPSPRVALSLCSLTPPRRGPEVTVGAEGRERTDRERPGNSEKRITLDVRRTKSRTTRLRETNVVLSPAPFVVTGERSEQGTGSRTDSFLNDRR